MNALRKPVFVAAGYNTTFTGSGRKEFDPAKPMRGFESYLKEAADGALGQLKSPDIDEGVICNFMAPRYLKQANLPGFLPSVAPALLGKPCTGVEGACGSGGRALATAIRIILSDSADAVLVVGFEVQNTMKAVYGADVLAGAGYYEGQRKQGHAHFFPGVFSDRAGAYYKKYGQGQTRAAMAKWYETAILNARKNPKAQEFQNAEKNLLALGSTPPDPEHFVPHLNLYDCSKISDGASALLVLSEAGLDKTGVKKEHAVRIIGLGAAEGDITQAPPDMTRLATTEIAAAAAYAQAKISPKDLAVLELHDCFTITAILALEATGFADRGAGARFILDGHSAADGSIPTNLSGGLGGFGHPVGATGVRQMVDLLHQLTGRAANPAPRKGPYGMMVSMGGNDITVTAIIVQSTLEDT